MSNGAKKPPTPKCKVPSLKGKTLSAATAALTSANCTLGTVKKKHSSAIPKGSVIKSSPKGGSKRKAGTAVNLTVSSGKKKKKK